MISEAVYQVYKLARNVARATGLSTASRKYLGRWSGKMIFLVAPNKDGIFDIKGHKMALAADGAYPPADMAMGRYEPETTRLFESVIKPGMAVMDVGAHVGYFTLLAARYVGPSGKVFAFEPEPDNYAFLKSNIERNEYKNITANQKAASDSVGTVDLYQSNLDTGSHSIYGNSGRHAKGTVSVDSTTIDEFLETQNWPQIDLIKIDVEGGEMAVLEGMQRMLSRPNRPTMIVEFCPFLIESSGFEPADLLAKLGELGYRLTIINEDQGLLPFEDLGIPQFVSVLFRQRTYVNLLCQPAE